MISILALEFDKDTKVLDKPVRMTFAGYMSILLTESGESFVVDRFGSEGHETGERYTTELGMGSLLGRIAII